MGKKPHAGQLRLLAEAKRWNVVECGRRWGKSEFGCQLVYEYAYKRGQPVAWASPTYKLLDDAWRVILSRLREVASRVDSQNHRIELISGGSVDFWTLEKPDAGRGRKYAIVVIDEAGIARNLKEAWEQALRPTLTDLKGCAWFLGTPKGRNYFHQLFQLGQTNEPGWVSWRMGTVTNPTIDPAEVEDARKLLPKQVFEQEYLGIPADDGGNPFGLGAIRSCIGSLSTAEPVAWGVDLAKSEDYTVAIGLDESGAVCRFERWQSPWAETLERVSRLIGQTPTACDSTGVGDPIVEALQRRAFHLVESFKFTSQSKQQIIEGVAVAIQTQAIRYPDGPIVQELESFEYEYSKTGVRYSAAPGLHDDCVCALALAVYKLRQPAGLLIGWA